MIPPTPPRGAAILITTTLAVVYMISQFLRNALAVLAPDLSRDLGIGPAEIGLLSGAFFLAFAVAQVPIGIVMDRYGPKACLMGSIGLAIAGTALFAVAADPSTLLLARVLMGLGCASFFMAPLAIHARWFGPSRFAGMAGLHQGLGTLGNLAATAPLAVLVGWIGWRWSFGAVALVAVVIALAALVIVRDDPPGATRPPARRESLAETLAGVAEATRVPRFWRLMAMHWAGYAAFAAVIGLWAGPLLADLHGLDLAARGGVLLIGVAANVVGLVAWGAAYPRLGGHRRLILTGAVASLLCLVALAAWPGMPLPLFIAWLAVFGFATGFQPLYIAEGRTLFPERLTGRGMTCLNIGTMGGGFALQVLVGYVIALTSPDHPRETAYMLGFLVVAAWLLLLTVVYAGGRAPRH